MSQPGRACAPPAARNALASTLRRFSSFWRKQNLFGKVILSFVALCVFSCSTCSLCALVAPPSRQAAELTPTAGVAAVVPATEEATPSVAPSPTASAEPSATATATGAPAATATRTRTSVPSATPGATASATPSRTPTKAVAAGPLKVHFVDVGQGDAILIQAPSGEVALVDGGEANSGIVQYLRGQGVQRIDLMVATHPHSDHIGGLVDVLRAMPVGEVVTNGQPHTTRTYERFLDAIADGRAVYTEARHGDALQLGSVELRVLHPVSSGGSNLNDNSLVLRLVYGATSFLLTGDVEAGGQGSMMAAGQPIQANVLKVPHHGSRSSSMSFLASAKPQVAVYSCGAGNSYGHPHAETMAALLNAGAKVYGTEGNGTVVVTTDGGGYSTSMARQVPSGAPPTAQPTAAPTSEPTAAPAPPESTCAYVASSRSDVFHHGGCSYVGRISPANRTCFGTREEAVGSGRRPCKVCNP